MRPGSRTEISAAVTGPLDLDDMPERCHVVLVNAEVVHGRIHLLSAVQHAERAFREGRNRARRMEIEVILYLTGERQISTALEMASPGERNVIASWDCDVIAILSDLGLQAKPLPEKDEDTPAALERTALLDIRK